MVANNANIADRVDSPSVGILIVTKDLQYLVGELVSIFISLCFIDIVIYYSGMPQADRAACFVYGLNCS